MWVVVVVAASIIIVVACGDCFIGRLLLPALVLSMAMVNIAGGKQISWAKGGLCVAPPKKHIANNSYSCQ